MRRRHALLNGSCTIAKFRGIAVRLHFTLLLALPYFAFHMVSRLIPVGRLAGVPFDSLFLAASAWAWGAWFAIAFLVAIVFHEVCFLVALKQTGVEVRAVSFSMTGGVLESEWWYSEVWDRKRCLSEFGALAVAVAGSMFGALLSYLAAERFVGASSLARFGLLYLSQLLFLAGALNLIPIYPFNAGRVVRAFLLARYGVSHGSKVSMLMTQCLAVTVVVMGVLVMNGLVLLLGAALFVSALSQIRQLEAASQVAGLVASDLMHGPMHSVEASVSVNRALIHARSGQRLPVRMGRQIVGLVDRDCLERVPEERRDAVPVGLAADHDFPIVLRSAPAERAVELLRAAQDVVAVVTEDGSLAGLIDEQDVDRSIERSANAGNEPRTDPPRNAGDKRRARDRENPCPDDTARDAPANRRKFGDSAHAYDGSSDGVSR